MEWMAYGLQYLHNQGFVHRDVKPANFFLTNNGEIKLLDFGIIKSLRQGISSNLTRATQILGTPSYKAPEQINQLLGSITFKTDVYGLGVALFELFTRQLPFKGGSAFEIERQHLQEEIPNPQLFNALIPDAVSNLIQWCLQKTPAERPEIENVIQTIRSVSIGYSASAEQHTLDEITALSRVGLREEAQVTAEEQKIVEQEIEKAGETRSLVDWQMLGKRRGKVLAELKKRREQNSTVLEQYAQQLSEWTLGQYPQLCPNLLCLAERREGSRVCGNCQCDFSGMLCAACGRQTSFFSQRCQMCGTSVDLQVKIGFAAECVAIAKKADELECAKAYLAMQWLLKNYKLDAKWQEKAKEWHKAFANANSRWLQDKLEAFRQGCREIVANARKSQIEQLKSQKEQLIPRAQLLLNGGQPLDALEELHKIPCEIRDKQTEQLLNQIHEVLTANELQEAESMLKSKSPEKVLSLLKGLRYKSERQTRLLQEAAQAIETRNKEQIRQRQQQEQEQIRQIQQEQIRQIQQKRRNLLKIVGSIVAVVLAVLIWWMVKCPSGQERCGGQCVDLASNAGHCGGCGKVCSGGAICKAGECVCASGQERCGGQCVDLASNAGHCGGCGKVCSGGAMCKAGKCVRDENYAYIPAGSFIMGSPDNEPGRSNNESPRRKVTISRPFRIMRTEMTQGQFQSLMGYNPSHFNNCGANCPVENVNWHEACASANALSRKHGLTECYACRGSGRDVICEVKSEFSDNYQSCPGWRLPTEAEWEYAARAGSSTAFYNGAITKTECELDPNLNKIGWYCGNSGRKTHPVGGKQANAWGLYDMSGNVYEWVHDWYQDSYRNLPTVDPVGPNTGSDRVFRGGSYDYFALSCRAAIRYRYTPTYRYGNLGLRFLRSL
jgi:formylglycine-generating enzyme required for sulfatase activity